MINQTINHKVEANKVQMVNKIQLKITISFMIKTPLGNYLKLIRVRAQRADLWIPLSMKPILMKKKIIINHNISNKKNKLRFVAIS